MVTLLSSTLLSFEDFNEIVDIEALCASADDNEPKIVANETCSLRLNL